MGTKCFLCLFVGLSPPFVCFYYSRHLHRMLGGQSEFNMFHTEIGDTKILQGMIALVIFARTK